MKVVYSEIEKRAVLTALKSKGIRQPPSWKLIHKQECNEDELRFDHSSLLKRLEEQFHLGNRKEKFAINVVSNPDETSALDNGVLKVRFRYVLSAAHQGESKIKSNSREFCVSLINQDKLYRLEDINMMSFRGVNPIARTNYSIFKLRGHWNCRHTWQREVYLVERDNENVENNELIKKTLEMAVETKKDGIVEKVKNLFSTSKEKITMSEAVALAKELMDKAKFAFKDIKVGEKTLRIEGEEIKDGLVVAWVAEDGTLVPVEEPELTIEEGDKKVLLVIKDSMISEVKEPTVEDDGEEMEDAGKLKEGDEFTIPDRSVYVITDGKPVLKKEDSPEDGKFSDVKKIAELEKKIDEMAKNQNAQFSDFKTSLLEEIKSIPALKGADTKNEFSGGQSDPENRYSALGGNSIN